MNKKQNNSIIHNNLRNRSTERKMLVTKRNLRKVIDSLRGGSAYGLDTETTGLQAYSGDRLFSLILTDRSDSYYFNFLHYDGLSHDWILDRESTFRELGIIFENPLARWYIQNAKFDLAMLRNEGVTLEGEIWDTEVAGRLLYNRYLKYSLGDLGSKIGLEKDSAVDDYVSKNRVYSWLSSENQPKKAKHKHYDRVPFSMMSKYGEKDGDVVFKLGEHQEGALAQLGTAHPGPPPTRPSRKVLIKIIVFTVI